MLCNSLRALSAISCFPGIDDLLGLSGNNTGDGELNISDFLLNNTSPEMTNLGTATGGPINNGLTGTDDELSKLQFSYFVVFK